MISSVVSGTVGMTDIDEEERRTEGKRDLEKE